MSTTENYLDAALETTTFSKSQLAMLRAKIEESPQKTGLIELKTTATIDGTEIGAPYKTVALVRDGQIHRDKGPAVAIDDLVQTPDGKGVEEKKTVLYMQNGVPHREDGPAVLAANGNVLWMKNGELHRENGPAAQIDGKSIFALEGKTLTPEEYGKRTGLGEPGKDWMVEPNTGTMFTRLNSPEPAVATMRDAAPSPGQTVVVEQPALPRLTAASEAQRSAGESVRAETLQALAKAQPDLNPADVARVVGQDKAMSSANFWNGVRNMPVGERVAATLHAVQNENQPARVRLQGFDKQLGVGL